MFGQRLLECVSCEPSNDVQKLERSLNNQRTSLIVTSSRLSHRILHSGAERIEYGAGR